MIAGLGPARLLAVMMMALSVADCGFRPVYGPGAAGATPAAAVGLSEINVKLIPERSGQLLRQYLQQRFEGSGGSFTKLYDLAVNFNVAQEGVAISRADSVATRIRIVGIATWSLISMDAERKTVTSGLARSVDGFNPLDIQYFYSDLQTEQAQRRVAEAVADQISLQLASYFHVHPPGG